jgi:hypothetical protein
MDQEHLPPLGPSKPWLVKDFPVSVREEITRAAAGQGVTVGEWLVAHFQKHGVIGVEVNQVYQTTVNSDNPMGLPTLIALAANPELPRWLRAFAARQVGKLVGAEPPVPPKRRPRLVHQEKAE